MQHELAIVNPQGAVTNTPIYDPRNEGVVQTHDGLQARDAVRPVTVFRDPVSRPSSQKMGISRNRCILWDGFIWRSKDERLGVHAIKGRSCIQHRHEVTPQSLYLAACLPVCVGAATVQLIQPLGCVCVNRSARVS